MVFFSSGDDISKEWAPLAVKDGAWAVDNSAAFRMDSQIHLVVPEVNGDLLSLGSGPQIIANPNCSTIQLVVALKPLHQAFGVQAVRVASYQAVSGAGQAGFDELHGQAWFYFGMTHFYGWKDMIELINKFLKSKSTERVWLEQMDDKLLAMQYCDVLVAVGARFDDRVIGNPKHFSNENRKIIHIDIDPSSISKRVKVDVPIVGDVEYTISIVWYCQ